MFRLKSSSIMPLIREGGIKKFRSIFKLALAPCDPWKSTPSGTSERRLTREKYPAG